MRVSLFFRNERRRDRKRQGTGDFEWQEVIFAYVDFGCVFSLIFSLRFLFVCFSFKETENSSLECKSEVKEMNKTPFCED